MFDRKHVMILENDKSIGLGFKAFIEALPRAPEVSLFTDKMDGISFVYDNAVDLFITNVVSTYVTGLDFLRLVKADPIFEGIPVLVCTGYPPGSSLVLEANEAGANSILSKPISRQAFQNIIQVHLSRTPLVRQIGSRLVMTGGDR